MNNNNSLVHDYFIKDHLGNTRMTLTEDQEVVMYEATMEPEHESFETEVFLNITETRSTLEHFEGNNSALVTPESIGPAKMLVVTAGDVVDLQVYAKLASTTSNVGSGNQATLADALALLFGDNAVGASLYEQGVYNSLYNNRGSYLASVLDPNAATGTKAYLNYVFFDKDFNLVSSKSGYLPVTATTGFELISNNGLTIDEAGYLYVYVSNEGNSSNAGNVYFDALKVIHHKGHIVQEDHYYPFGLTIASLSSSAPLSTPNNFKFGGQELQTEFDLNWVQFEWRNHNPQIGRFFNIDPLSEKYINLSPYSFVANSPLKNREVDGRYFVGEDGKKVKVRRRKGKLVVKGDNASEDLKYLIGKVNDTGSRAAKRQIKKLSRNKTKVNVVVDTNYQLYTPGAKGQGLLGVHNAHDENGNELSWNSKKGDFNGTPAYVDGSGKKVYQEATITIFMANIVRSGGNYQDIPASKEIGLVFSHETKHDTDKRFIRYLARKRMGKTT